MLTSPATFESGCDFWIPGLCSSPAHEFSSAPRCSTCLLMRKSKAKSGRILVFQRFGSLCFAYSPLWERTEVVSGEPQEMGGDSSKIYTWDPVSPGSSPYKEKTEGDSALAFYPQKADSQYWQFPFHFKIVWRYPGLPCMVNLKNFLHSPVKWHARY